MASSASSDCAHMLLQQGFRYVLLDGKKPISPKWQNIVIHQSAADQHVADGGNLGLVIPDGHMVLDVDPRHGGDESFEKLQKDFNLPETLGTTTGGDPVGQHRIYKVPAGRKWRGKLDAYPGIDFLGKNKQVVIAPSVHPVGKGTYTWCNKDLPALDMPDDLIAILQRPAAPETVTDRQLLTPDLARRMFAKLDAADFSDYDEWLNFSMAVHSACGGDDEVRVIWEEWCKTDELRAVKDDQEYKWSGFTAGGGRGVGSVLKTLNDHDKGDGKAKAVADKIARAYTALPKDDFDPVPIMPRSKLACEETERENFGEPLDLWSDPQPPEFPFAVLPKILRKWVEEQAKLIGADPSAFAVAILAAASAAIPDHVRLKIGRGGYFEEPRLWGVLIGSPGAKKSPTIAAALAPLKALQGHLRDLSEFGIAENSDATDNKGASGFRPIIISDTTPEAAVELLKDRPHKILIDGDELAGWIGSVDRYTGGKGAASNRAFWLQSYGGDEFNQTRITRGNVHVPKLSACVLGGIQPERLKENFKQTNEDGLLQRFIPVVMGKSNLTQDLDPRFQKQMRQLFLDVHRLPPTDICLSEEAKTGLRKLEEWQHDLVQDEAGGLRFSAWAGKFCGLAARISLVLHVVNNGVKESIGGTLSANVMDAACGIIREFVAPHALSTLRLLGEGDGGSDVKSIAGYILTHRNDGDRWVASDFANNIRCIKGASVEKLKKSLSPLIAAGWLAPEKDYPTCKAWLINPRVYHLFDQQAAEEKARRERVHQTMIELGRNDQAEEKFQDK